MTDQVSVPATTPADPQKQTSGAELFLRCLVILVGIFFGIIAAFVIGVATGWLSFDLC